jgi:hypothetical protein
MNPYSLSVAVSIFGHREVLEEVLGLSFDADTPPVPLWSRGEVPNTNQELK